ncbi:saccharopine dehydrogenase NADP-binding domain-containing protein [Frankia sp. CNm7]|uniref:Saccharopine dehydrogenase NADP-binding domain-containing protein n=1 Tax=Frankia nepalensis TaxID=1836974 RepID=A0A937RGS7_9ACTN|nr:Gfo/Idh/MocA family oxidoreductase [Frankia nepalensis]MBL7495744.1 saccharopine dehydrogenase NADP-binding domain-containing protein [Frankia nepalensis]MBL7509018.1 saccharopine dehydrogenase NADP-binding domain-containing protein [Frankia nepalensis]MBL7523471.1 saccharopine dehydrogenase NADP-binding domain-containing protein [Frankia nepalensis]MBL7629817.1 saccharopine dehydrogenase NADP-binding domain-containing protein [Frankia nepalensis]
MIIIDTALAKREAQGRPIRVGMIGAGFMGRGLANQIVNSKPGMRLVAVANRTLANGERAYAEAGVKPVRVENAAALDAAIAAGTPALLEDAFELLKAENLDCVVDVTGAVEFGARVTVAAIERGLPIVTMNAELDGTVGPLLAHRAREAGVVLTGADGDQPGVQGNLMRFVIGLGVTPLVAGNIKGLQDEYRTPTTQKAFAERWGQDPHMVTSFADGTKISFEQAIVANAFGLTVPKRGMNGWDHEGHVDELTSRYDVDELRELGGIVDYVVKSKPGPGVFVLGTHDDPKQRHYLELYKLGTGPLYSFYTPYHLCHFEVPNTVARAVDFADAALAPLAGPRVDVIATAKQDLKAGHTLDGLGGYDTYGVAESSAATRAGALLPMGVAEGCVLTRDVAKDDVLTYADVALPPGRLIDTLREEQEKLFA